MTQVIDTNHNTSSRLNQLKAAGVRTIIRYVSTNVNGEKCIKSAEARAILDAGLRLGFVFEVWGGVDNFSHGDINAASGMRHGEFAAGYVKGLGAPSSAAIYFAIDTDVTSSQIRSLVLPYFQAAKVAVGNQYKIGAYGCGAVLSAVEDLVDFLWLSNAMGWNGSRAFRDSNQWNLLQRLPAQIAGLDTDPNDINPSKPMIGDYGSGAAPPPPAVVHDAFWLQRRLNQLGASLTVDGDIGPKSVAEIEKYLPPTQGVV